MRRISFSHMFIIYIVLFLKLEGLRGQVSTRIIMGTPAVEGKFPFQVSLRIRDPETGSLSRSFCSGTILSRYWILTAAHCLEDYPGDGSLNIVAGDIYNDDEERPGRQVVTIDYRYTHQDYNGDTKDGYDIELLKLSRPLQFTRLVQAVYLPQRYSEHSGGVVASGWGDTEEASDDVEGSDVLLYTDSLEILENEDCNKMGRDVEDSQLCVVPEEDGEEVDVCAGDSGGPLTQEDARGNTFILGIVSYGDNCTDVMPAYFPGVYTKVSYFIDWIYKTIVQSRVV